MKRAARAAFVLAAIAVACTDDDGTNDDAVSGSGGTAMTTGGASGGRITPTGGRSGGSAGHTGGLAGSGGTSGGIGGGGAGGDGGGGTGGLGGGGSSGVCECSFSKDFPNEPVCSVSSEAFCPPELRDAGCPLDLDALRRARARCQAPSDEEGGYYSECNDGTARIAATWGYGENDVVAAFALSTGRVTAARVLGYQGEACGLTDPDIIIDLSTEAEVTPAQCRVCRTTCYVGESSNGGAGGSGGACGSGGANSQVPPCVVDTEGRIALPPE